MQIKVKKLKFSYQARLILSISEGAFESGHIYGIVGNNGVGKTTFFKTLTNIITNYEGHIQLDGQEIKENPRLLAKVGIMLDDMELYKSYTGLFNLRYFGGLRGEFDEDKALSLAKKLDLTPEMLSKKVATYSLGMKKKLILLISVMNDAEILIFDEPFRGIDAKSVEWFRDYLLELKGRGRLILISSHVQEDIETICDKVYLLANGDFTATFDLKNQQEVLTYTVSVTDVQVLADFLTKTGVQVEIKENTIKFLRKLDHSMIFILIAGSYAPFCLISLNGFKGWILFGVEILIAVLGVSFKLIWFNCPRWVSTIIYVVMGWGAIFLIVPLYKSLSTVGLMLLVGGGVFYTIGAIIYGTKPKFLKLKKLELLYGKIKKAYKTPAGSADYRPTQHHKRQRTGADS